MNTKSYCAKLLLVSVIICCRAKIFAQTNDSVHYKIIAADTKYIQKPKLYQWLWGYNRRKEWSTPVKVPILWLDSMNGGLTPYKTGGGNETKTLHLKSANGKLYSLRSINKSRKDVILPQYENTFIAGIIKDGVSMSYPYGAFGVSGMEEQSGIHHTKPQLVYLPAQAALDTFTEKFGSDLYLFEEKLDGDWSNENNLGNFTDFTSTDKLVKAITENNLNKADQYKFLKARLLDILIADWDRHEDNWEWGRTDTLSFMYEAVPKDRDQAFFTHNGFLIDKMLPAEDLGFMQNFDKKPGEMKLFNTEEKHMDRFFTNALSYSEWVRAATDLENELTDHIIYNSVKELPPEIFSISGIELIKKLKSRRKYIVAYTKEYYRFLSKEVDIVGSEKPEYFDIQSLGDSINISIYRLKNNVKETQPFYSRTFYPSETKIIYVYGINGSDVFKIDGNNSIQIKIIGGFAEDSVMQTGKGKVFVFDDKNNVFKTSSAKLRLRNDSGIHEYDYNWYRYNHEKIKPSVFYSNEDRLYLGLGYSFKTYKWRKDSFATKQLLDLHYSISQNAVSVTYTAAFPNIIGKWSLNILANYDAVKWTNFYGLGNNTKLTSTDKNYFRMRSREWFINTGLQRQLGKNTFTGSVFFQSVNVLQDTERFVSKIYAPARNDVFQTNNYAGIDLQYTYVNVNDSVVPTRGFEFLVDAAFKNNFTEKDVYQNYSAKMQAYLPLISKFSLAVKAGAARVGADDDDILNSAQFYEHAVIGGPESLRGYKRERFWGKTSFYNNNELRFITDLHTHIMNAKLGLIAFFDDGRVWLPLERSNTLHTSYGGGIMLAPFNAVSATITYGISKESKLIQIRIDKLF